MATDRDFHRKYRELTQKYTALVRRLDRRLAHDVPAYRLALWSHQLSHSGFALVRAGQIEFANSRFHAIAQSLGRCVVEGHDPYGSLRTLVLQNVSRLLATENRSSDIACRSGETHVLVHLESTMRKANDGGVLVRVDVEPTRSEREAGLQGDRDTFMQRERLRVLGELAAGIAHDLGNTLRGASFQLSAAASQKVPDASQHAIAAAQQRIDIATRQVMRLHEFARTGDLEVSAINLGSVMAQAIALVEGEFTSATPPVRLEVAIGELPLVQGSVAELSLMFVNLMRNARDAMPEGGVIRVRAKPNDQTVTLFVEDEGIGIPAEDLARVFDPFFSTKGARGTGLGLWLASTTMARVGGTIRAANRNGGGARFTLEFPLATLSQPPRPSRARAKPAGRAGRDSRPPRRAPSNGSSS